MEIFKPTGKRHFLRWAGVFISALACLLFVWNPHESRAENERVVTIYHDGVEQTVVTDATTVKEVLERTHITLNKYDAVEPARDTQLVAPTYSVNVFRARPVAVIDGQERYQIMSPHTSARKIAETAGLKVYDEDSFDLSRIDDFLGEDGVGLKLTIDRSVPIVFNLYGKRLEIRTQAQTVGALLKDKNVVLGSNDGASLPLDAPILTHMELNVWRNGVQTVTEEKEVPFATEFIRDTDRDIGYREVKTPGKKGKKQVMFEIELRDGQEVSRKEIHSVVTEQPTKQIEVIGAKSGKGLSKSKGVNYFVDSKGVQHRETYYDLPMGGVMRNCGGTYSVRADGAKVDQNGYILVAANLSRYPRCSVVETSLGLGKVYDTGGFATVHPDGFDLATDWSNNDGR